MKHLNNPLNPDISTLIRRKARKLAHQPGFHRQDENDLMQDFWCHVLARLQLYDESRGCSEIGFVAMLIEGSFAMFASVTGTWLPFLLIFMATHLTGRVMGRTAPSWCLRPGAKIAPGCP